MHEVDKPYSFIFSTESQTYFIWIDTAGGNSHFFYSFSSSMSEQFGRFWYVDKKLYFMMSMTEIKKGSKKWIQARDSLTVSFEVAYGEWILLGGTHESTTTTVFDK